MVKETDVKVLCEGIHDEGKVSDNISFNLDENIEHKQTWTLIKGHGRRLQHDMVNGNTTILD